MQIKKNSDQSAFSLLELIFTVILFGIMVIIIFPAARHAYLESRFSIVRQNASEAGSYVVMWAQDEVHTQKESNCLTMGDYLIGKPGRIFFDDVPRGLVSHYTGHEAFDGVEQSFPTVQSIINPFNKSSIFDSKNNDIELPSTYPGLLYLASVTDKNVSFKILYFTFTGTNSTWYNGVDPEDENSLRKGIFVARISYPEH